MGIICLFSRHIAFFHNFLEKSDLTDEMKQIKKAPFRSLLLFESY